MPSHLGLLSNANTPLIITITKEASHKVVQEDTDYIKQQITETLKTTRERWSMKKIQCLILD